MYFPHTVPDEDHPAAVAPPDEEEMTEQTMPLNKGVPLDDLPDQLEPEKLEVEGKPMMRRSSSLSDLAAFIDFQNFNQERMTKKQVRSDAAVVSRGDATRRERRERRERRDATRTSGLHAQGVSSTSPTPPLRSPACFGLWLWLAPPA